MSQKYTGGFITKSPVAPTTTAASGIWTLDQQQQAQKAGTWPSPPIFIEDLFSTYLYTGNGSTQTITNGIDLSTKGGLVWIKSRMPFDASGLVTNHVLMDSVTDGRLRSNTTGALLAGQNITRLSSGFTVTGTELNSSTSDGTPPNNYASWTFAKAPKFFDVVTYTGNGGANNVVNHALAASIGMLIIKRTDDTGNWSVFVKESGGNYSYWNSSGTGTGQGLNGTGAATGTNYSGFNAYLTTTSFNAAQIDGSNNINANGASFVAYLFASNAGGFPVSGGGSNNAISCGSYTTDGSGNATINLGYEPQWLLQKSSDASGNWFIADVMRGMTVSTTTPANLLRPNLANAESTGSPISPTPTGFIATNFVPSTTYIYIAIRRGPMKTPTTGTSVFLPSTAPATTPFNVGFPPDLALWSVSDSTGNREASTRLQGGAELFINTTAAEMSGLDIGWASKTNFWYQNVSGGSIINWLFRRAPGFCDVVCYTGTGSARTITHNLGAVPELMIMKRRDTTANWPVYTASTATNEYLFLNSGGLPTTATTVWNNTAPTSSVFSVGTSALTNASAGTYVAYLFSSCAGVSKVGSYTGTGALQTINCGFTSGARFVLIKLISSGTSGSGDWYVWDSARGISSGNDPYLLLDSTSAEVTGTNYVDTDTTGFKVTAAGATDINASGDIYLFLAIA